jgi:tetratricopeptide (TPR) repeat protein
MRTQTLLALILLLSTAGTAPLTAQEVSIPLALEGSPAGPDSNAVDLLIFDGELYLDSGDMANAAASFMRVIAMDPERLEGHLLLARALTTGILNDQVKDIRAGAAEALKQYRWVLARDPDNTEAQRGIRLLLDRYTGGRGMPMETDRGRRAWAAGEQALRKNDGPAAVEAFAAAANAEPKNPVAHRALGGALRMAGRPDDALAAYTRALELDQTDYESQAALGQILAARADTAAALVHFRRAFALEDTYRPTFEGIIGILGARDAKSLDASDLALLGRACLAAGEYAKAESLLEDAAAEDPVSGNRKALGIAKFFLAKDAEAETLLTGVNQENPQDPEVLYYLAASALRRGHIEDGKARLRSALALDPEDGNALRLLGLTLADQPGQEAEAIELLERARDQGAQIDNLPCVLGSMELRLGHSDQARHEFTECAETNPDFPGAQLGLGIIADEDGRRGEAIIRLERYLQLTKPDPAALFRLGVDYLRVGRDEQGYATLRRVVEMDTLLAPSDSARMSDTQLLEMTSFFLATVRRFDDAIFIGEMLLARDPENAIYNNNLAMSYADAGENPERAYELAQKANRLTPDDSGHLDTLAWTLVRLRRYEDAEKTFLKSLRLAREQERTDLSEIYYHLGYLYRLMDRPEEATDYLTRALENPPTPFVKAEIERLLELQRSESGGGD